MPIRSLLAELDERNIARQISIAHDTARLNFFLRSNTVRSFDEFGWVIGDFYNDQFTRCVSHGGRLSISEATSRAKAILEKIYRRRGGNIMTCYSDCVDGLNGGLSKALDIISEELKTVSVENFVRDCLDRHIDPSSWQEKINAVESLIAQLPVHLRSTIEEEHPERYASSYEDLVRGVIAALRETSSIFRRL